jgi:hypothetical protein
MNMIRFLRMVFLAMTLVDWVAATAQTDVFKIAVGYTGLGKYRDYTCPQLVQEARKLSLQAVRLSGQRVIRRPDAGNVLIWPDELEGPAADVSLVKEQMRMIENASVQSQCSIEFRRPQRK